MQPRLRLSVFWFLVTGALGVFFPYFTLYLKENVGLPGGQVGVVVACLPLVGMLAQPFWGQVADRTGSRTRTLAVLALGAAMGYAGLRVPGSFWGVLTATVCLAVFSTSLMPMGISVSLASLEEHRVSGFGRVRMWGTVGFLIAVVGTPRLLHGLQEARGWVRSPSGPSEPGLENVFLLASLLLAAGSVVAWTLPHAGSVGLRASRGDYRILVRHGAYVRVLVFAFFSYLFLHGPMVLFPIYVRSRGGDMDTVSYMWIWMLLLEIPLVASAGAIFARVGPRVMVATATAVGGIRWFSCALATDLGWVYPVQMLHAVVVVGLLVGAPLYVEALIPERLRSTGQGLLTTFGGSIGGVLSATCSGWVLERWGPTALYLIAGVGAMAVAAMAPLLLPKVSAKEAGRAS